MAKPKSRPTRWNEATAALRTHLDELRQYADGLTFNDDDMPSPVQFDIESHDMEALTEEEREQLSGKLSDAVTMFEAVKEVQDEYQEWLDNLPENLQQGNLADKLQAVVDIDLEPGEDITELENALDEAEGAAFPLGFGRD